MNRGSFLHLVYIKSVDPNSTVYAAGLRPGMQVLKVVIRSVRITPPIDATAKTEAVRDLSNRVYSKTARSLPAIFLKRSIGQE